MSREHALALALGLLLVANLLNNRLAPRAYLGTCLGTTALLVAVARQAGCSWACLGLGQDTLARGLAWGMAAFALVALGYGTAAALSAGLLLDRRVAGLDARGLLYQVLIRVPFGTVLLEEIAFRGVLYGLVRPAAGPVAATVFSSLLFGLWHVLPSRTLPAINPVLSRATGRTVLVVAGAVIVSALAGVVFCELLRRSGSLLAPAGLHAATNTLGYLAAFVVTRQVRPCPGTRRAPRRGARRGRP
ncbi:CPBP family intramembrane metalloprotease [Carbonactinospora thermoautotrophica]|uniref:CPBP family intramembrane glutamic endopeptidase n=1 Tax=Carbonactinospora thermoautotrophica TaxID=1469144 RepID=UPI00099E37F5|nr:CPBP family intramembrane glutamic endopeptidase [Carbonactinospora thermoautotrophica]MCX9191791.1 CPBP family intramembrane metalloprotease [Carbonactinospora thermoautotrophica]